MKSLELFADNLPEGATFTGSAAAGYRFEWTPTVEQGCVHVGGTTASCLGGAETYLIPLRMFPPWLRELLDWLPFRYQIGLPVELLPLLLTVDWIIARGRTVVNVLSDMLVSILLDRWDGRTFHPRAPAASLLPV